MNFRGTTDCTAVLAIIAILYMHSIGIAQVSSSITERGEFVQVPIISRDLLLFPNLSFEQEFNSSDFVDDDILTLEDLPDKIAEIYLVYTSFRISETFNQSALNKKRIEKLNSILPNITANKKIKWKFIAQTAPANEEQARKYFHGFILVPKISRHEMARSEELKMISKVSSLMASVKTGSDTLTKIKCRKKFSGNYMPRSKAKQKSGVVYANKGIWKRKKIMTEKCDTFKVVHAEYKSFIKSEAYNFITDTIVSAVLNRNKHWRDLSLVVDVTGSMSPYIADVILWANINQHWRKVNYLTCFNDGDKKSDKLKIPGKTGGIYQSKIDSSDVFEKLVNLSMRNGSGGDWPENDIEALLKAQSTQQAGELILICDNWSPVRDIKLIEQLNIPVHIIVCGSAFRLIHPDYIKLAYETGGSVHTLEDDFTELYKHLDGEVIKLGNSKYRLRDGNFKLLSYN